MFKSSKIYYMSGTGNTYRASVWAAEKIKAAGISCEIIPMERAKPKKEFTPSKETLLGFFCPTHGFTAPWPAIKFAFKMPLGKGTNVFISASRAGWMIGPWHLPGLEGTTTILIALILLLKGYDIRGFQGLDMPSNWLAVHWGMKKENALWFVKRAKLSTEKFTSKILDGKHEFRGWVFIIIGILLVQLSLAYILIGRLMLSKIMFADYRCNSCGICWNNCPYHAIKPIGKKNPTPYWTFNCESCERCIAYCPQEAIQTGFMFLFFFYWLIYGVIAFVPALAIDKLAVFVPWIANLKQGPWFMVISVIYNLLCMGIGYYIFILLVKNPVLNRVFTFTTPTKVFRRYSEPETRLKDLK